MGMRWRIREGEAGISIALPQRSEAFYVCFTFGQVRITPGERRAPGVIARRTSFAGRPDAVPTSLQSPKSALLCRR